jgi:hypothetical protein
MLNGCPFRKHLVLGNFFLLMVLMSCGTLRADSITNTMSNELTNQDKSEIIKSILERELKAQEMEQSKSSDFPKGFKTEAGDRYLSTENIAFFRLTTNLAAHFKLIRPAELIEKRSKREFFECFIFKGFVVEDAKVIVKLSKIQTSFFFGGYLDIPEEVKYEYRKVSGRWEGRLI